MGLQTSQPPAALGLLSTPFALCATVNPASGVLLQSSIHNALCNESTARSSADNSNTLTIYSTMLSPSVAPTLKRPHILCSQDDVTQCANINARMACQHQIVQVLRLTIINLMHAPYICTKAMVQLSMLWRANPHSHEVSGCRYRAWTVDTYPSLVFQSLHCCLMPFIPFFLFELVLAVLHVCSFQDRGWRGNWRAHQAYELGPKLDAQFVSLAHP